MEKREEKGLVKIEENMNNVLERVGFRGWLSVWAPGNNSKRGEVIPRERLVIIYDKDPARAWETFQHELVELTLRRVLRPYRLLCNKLIELVEEVTYIEKEAFIKELPDLLNTLREHAPEIDSSKTA